MEGVGGGHRGHKKNRKSVFTYILLLFKRVDANSMEPYKEPLYSSKVVTTITNLGVDRAIIAVYEDGERVQQVLEPGKSHTLNETEFSRVKIIVVPAKDKTATLRFLFNFDNNYSSSAWKLTSGWGDSW